MLGRAMLPTLFPAHRWAAGAGPRRVAIARGFIAAQCLGAVRVGVNPPNQGDFRVD